MSASGKMCPKALRCPDKSNSQHEPAALVQRVLFICVVSSLLGTNGCREAVWLVVQSRGDFLFTAWAACFRAFLSTSLGKRLLGSCGAIADGDGAEVVYKIRQWSLPGATVVLVLNVRSRVFWLELDDKALLDSYTVLHKGILCDVFSRKLQAKHLWMEVKLRWHVLADGMYTSARLGSHVNNCMHCCSTRLPGAAKRMGAMQRVDAILQRPKCTIGSGPTRPSTSFPGQGRSCSC